MKQAAIHKLFYNFFSLSPMLPSPFFFHRKWIKYHNFLRGEKKQCYVWWHLCILYMAIVYIIMIIFFHLLAIWFVTPIIRIPQVSTIQILRIRVGKDFFFFIYLFLRGIFFLFLSSVSYPLNFFLNIIYIYLHL